MLEPYDIEVIGDNEIDLDYCAWLSCKIGKLRCKIGEDLFQFFPDGKKPFSTGSYLRFRDGYRLGAGKGKFAVVGNSLFFQGSKENFYA